MCRNYTVRYGSLVNERVIVIEPRNSIFIGSGGEDSSVSLFASNLYDLFIPTRKSVTVLIIGIFSGDTTSINGHFAKGDFGTLENLVAILKGDSVLIYRAFKLRSIGCVARYGSNRRTPAGKGIGILRSIVF